MAKRGTDAFVAAAQLGFDRGITAFQRVGFFKGRIGGDNYFTAIDQGRITPRRNQSVDLLREADEWISRLASAATSDECPSSIKRAVVILDRRVAELAITPQEDSPSRLLAVLAALGACERALAKSFKWAKKAFIAPSQRLSSEWAEIDVSREENSIAAAFRLSLSVGGMRAGFGKGKEELWLRQHLEPIARNPKFLSWEWSEKTHRDVAWHDGDLADALNAILARRLVRVEKSGARGWPDWSPRPASLDDITAFIERRVNETLLADLIWGLSLVDWAHISEAHEHEPTDDAIPSSFYALLRLCFRSANKREEQQAIPLVPAILHRAIASDGTAASELAARRLRASGRAPLVRTLPVRGDIATRTAAAMLFPIAPRDFHLLERMILQQPKTQTT